MMKIDVEIITDLHGILHAKCVRCFEVTPLEITPEELANFLNGEESMHTCFPNMERPFREMLVSGFCPNCWKVLFKPKARS